MESKVKLSARAKTSYGLGAVGKDMVYMLSASYILYYFQDLLGVSAVAMGVILMAARIFDAFNDPVMGAVVAKTKTRWGKFRPWLLVGTITNALILYMMFTAPPTLNGGGLVAYAAVAYILWGITYTMMDIPYWSMIPAFTEGGKEREDLTTLARSCAGVGSAVITIVTLKATEILGKTFGPAAGTDKQKDIAGFSIFTAIVAILFIVFTVICCINVKERSTTDMKTATLKEMFRSLLANDQAMAVVVAIVIVNCSIYITSNLVIYFFKYDFGGTLWRDDYTKFTTFGGGIQILAMMLFYPFLRKFFSSIKVYYISVGMAIAGYISLIIIASADLMNVYALFVPAFFIFSANGMLAVITTVFLANTVDYGELINHRRDESVIFSMQTFVVKLASGVSAFIASLALQVLNLSKETKDIADEVDYSIGVTLAQKMGIRMTMAIIPIAGLIFALFWFRKKYILTDEKLEKISAELIDRDIAKVS